MAKHQRYYGGNGRRITLKRGECYPAPNNAQLSEPKGIKHLSLIKTLL